MKYIKLFEAFESSKLSKTLKFIKDEESKLEFIQSIRKVCDNIEFPVSKLKDEYFQKVVKV